MEALTSQAQQGSAEGYSQSDEGVHDYGGSPFLFFRDERLRSCHHGGLDIWASRATGEDDDFGCP